MNWLQTIIYLLSNVGIDINYKTGERMGVEYELTPLGQYHFRLEIDMHGDEVVSLLAIQKLIRDTISDLGDTTLTNTCSVALEEESGGSFTQDNIITYIDYYDVYAYEDREWNPPVQPTGSIDLTDNGTYDVSSYAQAVVAVPVTPPPTGTLNVTANGEYDCTTYAAVDVDVPTGYEIEWAENYDITVNSSNDGYGLPIKEAIEAGADIPETFTLLCPTLSLEVVDNDTFDVRDYGSVIVNVPQTDLSVVTASASDVREGKVFIDSDGNEVEGTIPVTASGRVTSGSFVEVTAGSTKYWVTKLSEARIFEANSYCGFPAPTAQLSVTANGTYATKGYGEVVVNTPAGMAKPNLCCFHVDGVKSGITPTYKNCGIIHLQGTSSGANYWLNPLSVDWTPLVGKTVKCILSDTDTGVSLNLNGIQPGGANYQIKTDGTFIVGQAPSSVTLFFAAGITVDKDFTIWLTEDTSLTYEDIVEWGE